MFKKGLSNVQDDALPLPRTHAKAAAEALDEISFLLAENEQSDPADILRHDQHVKYKRRNNPLQSANRKFIDQISMDDKFLDDKSRTLPVSTITYIMLDPNLNKEMAVAQFKYLDAKVSSIVLLRGCHFHLKEIKSKFYVVKYPTSKLL